MTMPGFCGFLPPIVLVSMIPGKLRGYFRYLSYKNLTTGSSNKINAIIDIILAKGRVKNIEKEPPEIRRDCRKAGSAKGPRTIANTAGAIG